MKDRPIIAKAKRARAVTTEKIEVAQMYRIQYESPKGRAECIKGILEGRAIFRETYGKECHSFHPVKGRKSRRVVP